MIGLDGSALKVLLSNVGEGIGGFIGGIGKGIIAQLKDIDADKLVQLGKGIAGIGIGIAAFGAGTAVGVVGGVVGARARPRRRRSRHLLTVCGVSRSLWGYRIYPCILAAFPRRDQRRRRPAPYRGVRSNRSGTGLCRRVR